MLTDAFIPFLLTAIVIELTPGPNMAWLALTGASAGRRAALAATAGIAAGLAMIALLAAFGLAELAQASPNLFALLRYGGAAYLLWLAWEAWTGRGEVSPELAHDGHARQWFRHGLLLNLLNPKAALFFVAILPNYVDDAADVMPQTLILSVAYVGVATFIHAAIALFAAHAHDWFQSGKNAVRLRRACAVMMAAVAIWFLISTGR